MQLRLAYGRGGLEVTLPDGTEVLVPGSPPPLEDAEAAVLRALRRPLGVPSLHELARPGDKVVIVHSDITRPTPNHLILPPLLAELEAAGVRQEDVTLLNGTGMHRGNSDEELRLMLGDAVTARYRCLNHDARDETSLAYLMTTRRGNEVWLNRVYLEADVRIVTGFVEPHIFAGYSGGGKGVLPGIAGAGSVMANHGAEMLNHPKATWCQTWGNPIWEEMREAGLASNPSITLQVTLDTEKRVTAVYAGELAAAQDAAIAAVERQAVREIEEPYDIVVATNIGFPADISLYQTIKGMLVAAQGVRQGGHIVIASECSEGVGSAEYEELLACRESAAALLEMINEPGFARYDQWGVQCHAMALMKARVWLYSSLPSETVERVHLRYCEDVSATVARLVREVESETGRQARVLALPYGFLAIPRLKEGVAVL